MRLFCELPPSMYDIWLRPLPPASVKEGLPVGVLG